MRLRCFRIGSFRRLKDVRIDLDAKTSVFVGSNNSGKTSATHIFQMFLGGARDRFSIHDFSADCWAVFDDIGSSDPPSDNLLPTISLDLWFDIEEPDLHRAIPLLPSLEWNAVPVGLRLRFAPKDQAELLAHFHEAKSKAATFAEEKNGDTPGFHPWPESLTDYLKKRLNDEYKVFYYVLDYSDFDPDLKEKPSYTPHELGDSAETGAKIVKSLLRVDFLHAQRHLSDVEARGRAEDLSRRLNRFYDRNLDKYDGDFEAVKSLAKSEAHLNAHLSKVFEPTLKSLNALGYPGFANPELVIKSAFDPESILTRHTSVHYALRDPGKSAVAEPLTLPDKYNGLGFKNLIYMVVELLDFHQRWVDEEEERPLLQLIFIEEPEAHLHVQLQQVFIRKIMELLPSEDCYSSQLIVTTHSPHIIYEDFRPIRYFRRLSGTTGVHYSEVLNLSGFTATEDPITSEFLLQYMKLTHCDLFFADGAVLVEGNVERLLLPLMIDKEAPQLKSCYLSILELGGAFAHLFKNLIHFLGLTTLVITDLDSMFPPLDEASGPAEKKPSASATSDPEDETDVSEGTDKGACMVDTPAAVTSNQTLVQWLPKLMNVSDLLAASADAKRHMPTPTEPAGVRVAYQTREPVVWKGETQQLAGRTFEDAFAYENLEWCQDLTRKSLHLRVVTKEASPQLAQVAQKVYCRVNGNSFNKTAFALALMMTPLSEWKVPRYIAEGLQWLRDQLIGVEAAPAADVLAPEAEATE